MKTKKDFENTPLNQLIDPFPEIRTFPTGWGDLSNKAQVNVQDSSDDYVVSELDNSTTDAML